MRAALIERHARGVRLTEAGSAVLVYARNVDLDVRDALATMRDLRQGSSGAVRLGSGWVSPGAHRRCLQAGPRLGADGDGIQGGMSDSLFDAVSTGEADFAITGVRPPEGARLEWTPLFRDPMVVIVHRSHPLAGVRAVDWKTLASEQWMVANVGTMTRTWFEQQFRDRGLAPPGRIIGLRGYPIFYELAVMTPALVLVPLSTSRDRRDSDFVEIRRPPNWKSDRVVGLLARPGAYVGPAAQKVMNSIATAARRMFRDAALWWTTH